MLDHVDHIVRLVGVEHVGLGSDAGIDGSENYLVSGLNDASRVYRLTEGLLERGYAPDEIVLILGGNFHRVFSNASLCSVAGIPAPLPSDSIRIV
jgi:membrane dipeptidase